MYPSLVFVSSVFARCDRFSQALLIFVFINIAQFDTKIKAVYKVRAPTVCQSMGFMGSHR